MLTISGPQMVNKNQKHVYTLIASDDKERH